MRRVSVDGGEVSGFSIDVNECGSIDAIAALPINCKGGIVFLSITTVSDGEIRDCSCFLCQ